MNAVPGPYEVDCRFGRYWTAAGPQTRSAVFLGHVEKKERNRELVRMVVEGSTITAAALQFGIGKARAQQIFWKVVAKEYRKLRYRDPNEDYWDVFKWGVRKARRFMSYKPPPMQDWIVDRCQECKRLDMVHDGFCGWCVPRPEEWRSVPIQPERENAITESRNHGITARRTKHDQRDGCDGFKSGQAVNCGDNGEGSEQTRNPDADRNENTLRRT